MSIQLIDIRKTHINNRKSHVEALKGINVELPDKGFVLIVGGNGSGKSTLLSILGGLDTVTSGQFIVNEQDIAKYSQNQLDNWRGNEVSYVFQDNNLLSDFTVADNIRFGRALAGDTVTDDEITGVLERVRLEGFETRFPKDLSGGERQKVAIARALIKKPRIILIDEPISAADLVSSKNALQIFRELSHDVLVICVSHNENFIRDYADRIITIHEGLIANDLAIEHYTQPVAPITVKGTQKSKIVISQNEQVQERAPEPIKEIDTFRKRRETQKIMYGMAIKNLANNWAKAVFSTLVIAFALIFFTISIMMAGYDHASIMADDAYGKHPYYAFSSTYISNSQQSLARSLAGATPLYNYINYGFDGVEGIIELPENGVTANKFGKTYSWAFDDGSDKIYGSANLGVVITDYIAEQIVNGLIPVYSNTGVQLGTSPSAVADIDETCYIKLHNVPAVGFNYLGAVYSIHGIVPTDYHTQKADEGDEIFKYKRYAEYEVVYVAPGFAERFLDTFTGSVKNTLLHLQGIGTFTGDVAEYTTDGFAGNNLTNGGGSLAVSAVGDNDIVVSSALWERIRVTGRTSITLQINNGQIKTYDIKGRYTSSTYGIMFNKNNFFGNENLDIDGSVISAMFPTTMLVLNANGVSHEKLAGLIQTIEPGASIYFVSANSADIEDFSDKILLFQTTFIVFALFSLTFAGLFMYNYISTLVANKRRDIGILRSLGAKSNTVLGIFLTSVAIITLVAVIISIICAPIAAVIVNSAFTINTSISIAIFRLWHVMAIIGVSLIIVIASTFAPLYRYSSQPPVKQLKN